MCVQIIRQVGIFVYHLQFLWTDDKFLVESVAMRSLGIGIGDVADGDGLRAITAAYPVGIGQVDANGRGRIEVAGQDSGGDDLGRNALHLLLLELFVHRRMVFKPLGIAADQLRAVRSLQILKVDQGFPTGLQAQGVAIGLSKTVDKIHAGVEVLHPQDGVIIK